MSYNDIKEKVNSLYSTSAEDIRELEALHKIMPEIEKALDGRYEIVGKIAKGGAGIVFKVKDLNLGVPRALKCARPSVGKEPLLSRNLAGEISRIKGAFSQNIIALYYAGSVSHGGHDWPYYIMEYIEGGMDFHDYIIKNTLSESSLLSMLEDFVVGCAYLHSQNMVHGDVKLENALVTPSGRVIISDLGSARYLSNEDVETTITLTQRYAHPRALRNSSPSVTDVNRATNNISRKDLGFWLDYYPLGLNIFRILTIIDPNDHKVLTPYTRAYLQLMAARLLDGEQSEGLELPFGLTQSFYAELKYTSLQQVIIDLQKLTGRYSLEVHVPELDEHNPNKIQCSYHNSCIFTPRVQQLLDVHLLRRLAEISQLGMLAYIYPTANHSRLEHSLGTYTAASKYCVALWNDPINPFFRQLMTPKLLCTLLCAALCHDVGQYGLAHDFEEANKAVFSHTKLTSKVLLEKSNQPLVQSLHYILNELWNVQPKDVAHILNTDPTDLKTPLLFRLLHTIISGPIDADKADYIVRDSRKLGVPYGEGVDIKRLINCLTVTFQKRTDGVYISMGVHESGKIAAESMAFARYSLFGVAYWHHTSRALKSMLHRAIWEALPPKSDIKQFSDFTENFEHFVFDEIFTHEQLDLFKRPDLPHAPQLSRGDLMILKWLHKNTSSVGQLLVAQILKRNIFKRLMVVSYAQDKALWEYLCNARIELLDHKMFVHFQATLQTFLISDMCRVDIEALKNSNPVAKTLEKEMCKKLQTLDEEGQVLIIIDIPIARPGSDVELQYLSEERIQGRRQIGQVSSLEDSIVWQSISTQFLKSVGKIRIFAHPEFAGYFEILCSRDKIKDTIKESYEKTLVEYKKSNP